MIVRKLRLEKGWSQEQLAELCDVSVRTIQRIERGQKPSLESLKALAAVFETDVSSLSQEAAMKNHAVSNKDEQALLYVRDIKGFYSHLIIYAVVMVGLAAVNFLRSPHHLWFVWPALGWGVGVACHGLNVYEVINLLGVDWEKRQVAKYLRRKASHSDPTP